MLFFALSLSLTLSPSLVCRVGSEGGFNQSRPVWVSNWAIFPHKKNGCLRKRSDTSLTVTCASLWHVLSTGSDVFESCVYIYICMYLLLPPMPGGWCRGRQDSWPGCPGWLWQTSASKELSSATNQRTSVSSADQTKCFEAPLEVKNLTPEQKQALTECSKASDLDVKDLP